MFCSSIHPFSHLFIIYIITPATDVTNYHIFFHYLAGLKIKYSLTERMSVTKNERQLEEASLNLKTVVSMTTFQDPIS